MTKKIIMLIFGILVFSGLASALFSASTYQAPPSSFQTYYSAEGRLEQYWPILTGEEAQCGGAGREDIIDRKSVV